LRGSIFNEFTSSDSRYIFAKDEKFRSEDAIYLSADAEDATECFNPGNSKTKEQRRQRLENNFAKLFGRHMPLHAMRLTEVFVGTS